MSNKRVVSLAVALAITLLSVGVAAGEPLRFKTGAQCVTDGGSDVRIEPGRYIPEDDWTRIDDKRKAVENNNTRLTAENQVYKDSESVLGWKSAMFASLAGLALGAYIWKD